MAKERGYVITVVVRSKSSVEHIDGIHVIEGSVLDKAILERSIKGQNVVISCLGIKRVSQSNPWSALASPKDFMESITKQMIPIMQNEGINRSVLMSAAGVGNSWKTVSGTMKFLIKASNVKHAFNDFDEMEKQFVKSGIDVLSVRPVGLVDQDMNMQPKVVDSFKMSSQITRKDVAKWMVDALERKEKYSQPYEMIGY